jgi:outer membrane protein assembly factor BamD
VNEARALLSKANKRLAQHELYVAEFYAKRKRWPAAIARLENIARDYADAGFERDVFWGLYRAHHALGDQVAAQESLERLVQAYPTSIAAKEALVLLERSRKTAKPPAQSPQKPLSPEQAAD